MNDRQRILEELRRCCEVTEKFLESETSVSFVASFLQKSQPS
jgi:hypothetical protein